MNIFTTPASFILIIAVGFILKYNNIVGRNDYIILTKILLNVTLPAAVIIAFSKLSYSNDFFIVVLVGLISSSVPLFVWYSLSGRSTTQSRMFSMLNVSGFNVGCFALPFISAMLGEHAGGYAVLFDTGNALMMTGGAFAITTSILRTSSHQTSILSGIVRQLAKSHLFILYVFMAVLVAFGVHLPELFIKLLEPISQANSFVAMLIIGLMFTSQVSLRKFILSVKIIFLRLIHGVVFSILIYHYLPVAEPTRQVLAIIVFSPVSALAPLFTLKSKGDVELSSFINSLSIIIGLISMSIVSMIIL